MDALLALDSYILPASGSSLVSCLSTPSALDLVPMVLNLREATAMPAVERRASWLAGPLHVLRSVLLLAVARREALLLGAPSGRSSTSYRVASSDLHTAEARTADAVFYLRHLIQLPLLRSGQRGLVAELIAPRLRGARPCTFAFVLPLVRCAVRQASFLVNLELLRHCSPSGYPVHM